MYRVCSAFGSKMTTQIRQEGLLETLINSFNLRSASIFVSLGKPGVDPEIFSRRGPNDKYIEELRKHMF